jgi:hypothetical protein
MSKINLPSILTEDTHFYKEPYKEQLEPFLGRPYISYSTMGSWADEKYRPDFIKQKLAGISLPQGSYAAMGNYVGEAIENGYFSEDNPFGFIGQENLNLNRYRKPGAEYEKLVIIDRGEYVIFGFIDIYYEKNSKKYLQDMKTGGKSKEDDYSSDEYLQTVLYNYALGGDCEIGVNFIRRENSHVRPPLKISKEQFYIPNTYTEAKVKKILSKFDKAVKEISEIKNVYDKFLAQ